VHGRFRFPGLAPGSNYTVKAELQGFSPFESTGLVVNVGRNTEIELGLPAMTEVIDVLADKVEQPLLDPRRFAPGTTVTNADLERIPSPRDPWAVLQSTPGVLTDRMNVGGSESGQQSQYVGPGSCGDQAVWSMDGVVITDMAALGSSPGYYDFDAFEEMQVTTGGSDASIATGGVVLNMVTKRGTNEWRGSGRYLQSSSGLQSNLSFKNSDLGQPGSWNNGQAQTAFKQGNRIDRIEDYGAELGGPIVRDRLWIWGSYAKPKIDLFTIDNFSDKTTLKDWNAKLNAQVTNSNSATGFVWQSEKIKLGRNASPTRPQETTWDQDNFGPSPTTWKVEDSHIFSSSFFATGMYSKVNGGFELIPEGGDQTPFRDATLVWHNSFISQQIERPQEQGKLDGSSFFNLGNVSNELKYGAGYRTAESSSLVNWPGSGLQLTLGGNFPLLILSRAATPDVKIDYTTGYAQDTLALGNLTANIGLRWDRQGGKNLPSTAAANVVAPDLLPAVRYAGQDAGFTWSDFTPRIG
ncbi:MAG TPA: TonB-dependent receptor, partial [Thermoanaerobaculia bacterium]|nr:TonB-dependent receptor [Thermoanaerobaculia bacterium]